MPGLDFALVMVQIHGFPEPFQGPVLALVVLHQLFNDIS